MANAYAELTESSGPLIQMDENSISGQTVEAMVCVVVSASGLSDSYVGINEGSGKLFQYFENTISGTDVNAIAVVPCTPNGIPL